MIINQRVEKEYFDHIAAGDKRDLRLANRAVREGDTVILEEWDRDTREYTGRKVEALVTAVCPAPAADRAAEEDTGGGLHVIEFRPKESKFTPAS
jgi:Domain of unknown function (DUF3850)